MTQQEPTMAESLKDWLNLGTGVANTVDGIVNKPKPVKTTATAAPVNWKLIGGIAAAVLIAVIALPLLLRRGN